MTSAGEWMTVAEAMFRYHRSRVSILAIAKVFRDINGADAVPMKKNARTIRALCVSPELDAELRRKK